jgi:TusA-related sulfurtransferase
MSKKQSKQKNKFHHEITVNRIACPLHVLDIKKGMKLVEKGETLKINSTAYVVPELLAAARQMGSKVTTNDDNEIFIRK